MWHLKELLEILIQQSFLVIYQNAMIKQHVALNFKHAPAVHSSLL